MDKKDRRIHMKKTVLGAAFTAIVGMSGVQAQTVPLLDGVLKVADDPRFGIVGGEFPGTIGTVGDGKISLTTTQDFFGAVYVTHSGRVFGPGTYSFNTGKNNRNGDTSPEPYEGIVVADGQVGGHMLIDWNGYQDIDVVVVWDVIDNGDGTTSFIAADAPSINPPNPDGLAGFLTREGVFTNASAVFDFTIPTPVEPVTKIPFPLQPHSTDSVVLDNVSNVDEGVAMVQAKLEKEGFEVVVVIDHSRGAATADVIFPPNIIIIARPPRNIENELLKKSKTIGIELPMKFHVYEDEDGMVRLATNSIGYLMDRHDVKPSNRAARLLDKFNEQFGKEERGMITMQSQRSFDDTVAALQEAIVQVPGIRVPYVVDFGASRKGDKDHHDRKERGEHAASKGPVVIGFGNPDGATPLVIQAERRVGMDLPLKFLVWLGDDGEVNITTNDFGYIAKRHNLKGFDEFISIVMEDVLGFMKAGAGVSQ